MTGIRSDQFSSVRFSLLCTGVRYNSYVINLTNLISGGNTLSFASAPSGCTVEPGRSPKMWRCSRRLQKLVTYENLTIGESFPRWGPDIYIIHVLYLLLEENYVTQFLNNDNCRSMLTPNVRILQKAYCIHLTRLQNSPYFCVFKYARAVKQKAWNEAENRERYWRVRLARFSCARLLRQALPISLLILRTDCFAVYHVT